VALDLSIRTRRALEQTNIEPNIIVKFEGIDILFSAQSVKEIIRIGDPGFFIGAEGYFIGGLFNIEPEKNRTLIDSQSTTFTIRQQMNYDEGESSSVSSMSVGLVDKDEIITRIVTPGEFVPDVLGSKAQIFITFGAVSFFDDSIEIFKGVVTAIDSHSGIVKFKLNHPDTKKIVKLFKIVETRLAVSINASQTDIELEDASSLFTPTGPFEAYLRIGTEIIQYTGVSGNDLLGVTRGVLGTTGQPADAGDQARPIYSIEGNPLELALQIMLSGHGSNPVYEGISVSSFLQIGADPLLIPNAIYFEQVDIKRDFGFTIGDTVETTGAINGANNVSRTILDIQRSDSGTYIVVDGAPLVLEQDSTAEIKLFTQFNTMPDGMRMRPDEVDIDEHLRLRDFFHSSAEVRIYFKSDEIDGKEFLDDQLYRPIACYALPRKAKSSVGYTIGPIPGDEITSFDLENTKDPSKAMIFRTSSRAFFNEVVYKYDDTPLVDEEKFLSGKIFVSQTSKNRIKGVNRAFVIESLGLRTTLNAQNIIDTNAQRILDRYKFAAETVHTKALLRDSVRVEIGDIVIGDFKELQLTDISKASRDFRPRLFEVQNKSINLKTGDVDFALLDTGLDIDTRFGLISPGSYIASVVNQSQIVVGPDPLYGGKFGLDEFRKWENIINVANPISAAIRNSDLSIYEDVVITGINNNVFTLQSAPSITIVAGYYIEFSGYEDADTSIKQKLVYGYMTDDPTFLDGEPFYSML